MAALAVGPTAMAQHILEPSEHGSYEAYEGPPNAERAGISFFSLPVLRSGASVKWRIDYEVCNPISDHGIGFNWVEPGFAISRYQNWIGLAPRKCSYVWSDAWAVVRMDQTELLRNNGNSLEPAAYLRCPIDICNGDKHEILDSDSINEIGQRATVIDSRTGETYPIELSQGTLHGDTKVQYTFEWRGQSGIVVQIFPELDFEEISLEGYSPEAAGSYIKSGEEIFESWSENYSRRSALFLVADLRESPSGEANISIPADELNFRQSIVAIIDDDGNFIIGMKGLDL